MIFGKRKREEAAQRRATLRHDVTSQGWSWNDAQPPCPFELTEASLRGEHSFDIWPVGLSEVIDGSVEKRAFRAARLIGYRYSTTNGGLPYGDRRETTGVWLELPASLPELRMVDTLATEKDLGLALPPLEPSRTADGRWQVEGFVPAFATDLLQPAFVEVLSSLPPLSAVVIRAGVILAYGLRDYDVPTIRAVAHTLDALLDRVPASSWGRADALVAGVGVFPNHDADGPRLVLDRRLVHPDWKGYGLGNKIPWQEAPDAPSNVLMKRSEAIDRWEAPSGARPGLNVSAHVGSASLGTATPRGIPTVASTLLPGPRGDS
ncbi:hypothetical protein [Microbacterium sp. SL75]|uniref:hypothetical protein n=1 Tax=Microbacterium sp. SL75 TaxID=2995140 RepID=UPI00226DB388|nr:hypothetical protein [Microbacterium sp. SL75]WAC69389.1 hypothetical protein OVA17_01450 [Microbacterium sp. SL75]